MIRIEKYCANYNNILKFFALIIAQYEFNIDSVVYYRAAMITKASVDFFPAIGELCRITSRLSAIDPNPIQMLYRSCSVDMPTK